ncbi:carbohydrate ABC transporter permease [Catenuloplanes atrovinosus]|uniref:Raffinose/stachyose/melibiose transport system permease protein n=1 Tax=Catenuloplanes atrovinosus TaxID=137266 RepID=A0AAE3YVS1_9ACTN|nr:sugar ABC transporter permease [Catenuloplanes atrovinosus]MDR7280793.1 raffinose/stachyose/melibiose transport system permease protein [Catenuloplanes atrovinosus]
MVTIERPVTATRAPAGPRPRRRRPWPTIAVFLAPALLLFGLLVLAPIAVAGYASFFTWNGFGVPTEFVGAENFRRLLADEVFAGDLRRTLLLVGLSIGVQLPFSLALAMLLHQPLRGRRAYRLVFFAPYVLSEVVTAVLFTMIFSPNQGLANHVTRLIGLGDLGATWLADTRTVMFSLFLVISWKYFGFHTLLYLAARQGIPQELHDAAATDGAGPWRAFRHITLPLLGPTIRISVFLSVLGTIQLFDMVWVLTGGGPIRSSETLAVTMFQEGFKRFQVGYASAISMAIFLISLVFGLLYQRFVLRRDLEGAITTMGDRR